jgi:hypothetical protein
MVRIESKDKEDREKECSSVYSDIELHLMTA